MKERYWSLKQAALFATTFVPIQSASQNTDPLNNLFDNQANVGDVLNSVFIVAISVGTILAMFRIAWAGWLYMGSSDMWSEKQHAKSVFQDAIIGLLILLAVWVILYQINPQILNVSNFLSPAQTT